MGDLLSKEILVDLAINLINIVVLFVVTKKLLYKPVKKYLDARKEKVAAAFTEAEQIKAEAEKAKAECDALTADAEKTKAAIISGANEEAKQKAKKIVADAEAQADAIIEDARSQASHAVSKAAGENRNEIADLALQISEKIMGRSVTDEDNRKIIDSFFAE